MESSVRCDLCEKLCHGPIRYAHKPYAFRFYNEHRRAVEKFNNQTKMQKQEEEKSGHQDVVLDDKWTVTETESEHEDAKMLVNEEEDYNTENSTGYISNASQLSDWTDAEPYEVEEETEDFEDFKDEQFLDEDEIIYVESELYDVLEEEDENSNEEEDGKTNNKDDFDSAEESELNYFEQSEEEIFTEENKDHDEDHISSSLITSITNHSRSLVNKHLDITIATSAAIMTAIANVNTSSRDVTKTYTSVAIATVGVAVGVKGILAAAQPQHRALPPCGRCGEHSHPETGCRPFCDICGDCGGSENWKDGSGGSHCLVICERCDRNCVMCEKEVAVVRRHHRDFCHRVHGPLTTQLSGGCRDGGVVGSSLLMIGVLTCATLPGLGWSMGAALVAGSILVCATVRVSSYPPQLRIRCHTCHKQVNTQHDCEDTGCLSWCRCCGVFNEQDGGQQIGENYCLQLCQGCSAHHD